jgi:hypothetical protein
MTGAPVREMTAGEDSGNRGEGRQWSDPFLIHFFSYGVGATGLVPVIEKKPRPDDDLFDFRFTERYSLHHL